MESNLIYYESKSGMYACVRRGPSGENYTFYKTPNPAKKRGTRVKAKNDLPHALEKAWFATVEDAEKGLAAYAEQRKWKRVQ